MIRRGLVFFSFVAFLLAGSARSQGDGPSLTALTPVLDLGALRPEQPDQLPVVLTALLEARGPWRIGLSRDPSASWGGMSSGPARSDIFVKTSSGRWAPLLEGAPVTLASGGATGPLGLVLSFGVKVIPDLDDPPGARSGTLYFILNDRRVADPVRVSYEVAPAAVLVSDSQPFRLRSGVDPTRPSQVAFERRTLRVYSNVPWVAEATLRAPMRKPGSRTELHADAVAVAEEDRRVEPLIPGRSVRVGAGPATGVAGAPLDLDLRFCLRDAPPEGSYASAIDITAKPATAPATGPARR
jgi:hypothetical protein